jgi:hypothetical protein
MAALVTGLLAGGGAGERRTHGSGTMTGGYGAADRPSAGARARGTADRRGPPVGGAPSTGRRVSLPALAGGAIVLSFSGPTLPAYARDILHQGRAAGVILFGHNVASPVQLRALTRAIRRAAGRRVLVCADQEGGPVRTVPFAAPMRAPPQQTTTALAFASARAAARQVRR